jgi:hypothetical protein
MGDITRGSGNLEHGEQLRYSMENSLVTAWKAAQVQHGEQLSTAKKATQVHGEQGMQSMGTAQVQNGERHWYCIGSSLAREEGYGLLCKRSLQGWVAPAT